MIYIVTAKIGVSSWTTCGEFEDIELAQDRSDELLRDGYTVMIRPLPIITTTWESSSFLRNAA